MLGRQTEIANRDLEGTADRAAIGFLPRIPIDAVVQHGVEDLACCVKGKLSVLIGAADSVSGLLNDLPTALSNRPGVLPLSLKPTVWK